MEKYLTEKEASALLSVSVHTLRNWRHLCRGPKYYKPENERIIRYKEEDLIEFMKGA